MILMQDNLTNPSNYALAAPVELKNIVYFFGPDTANLSPNQRINIKIGLSKNNEINLAQRLSEHQRHCPGDIQLTHFTTNQGDAAVRHFLCRTYPLLFGTFRGKGHDNVSLLVKDVPFLLDQATRYFNDVNFKSLKLKSFPLRQEQINCLDKTAAFFSDPINLEKEFLWDAKMRFGKTHVAYELIMRMDFGLTLILTGRPTDTKQAWINAMDHVDFDFGLDNFIDASKQKDPIQVDLNRRAIIFASLQDIVRMSEDGFKEKFRDFPTFDFDLIICDEYHLAFSSEKTQEALSKLEYKHRLNLSGTPFRALLQERFPDDAKFSWSYIDEQSARAKEIAELGEEEAEKTGKYYWLAPMKIFTILLSQDLYEDAELFTEEEGFTFTKLFDYKEQNGKAAFTNASAVNAFINSMSHGFVMPYSTQAHTSHQYNPINLKHTLWYVPGVYQAKLLADMLKKHKIFKDYDIIVAAGDNNNEGNDTNNLVDRRIADLESGRNTKHIGTITLSCGKLSHSVSIKEWGSVFVLSDMKSAQLYFQLIFRAQTPWKEAPKTECYVFDFNPNRTLGHLYSLAKTIANTGDPIPILNETLKVFNVICCDGNEFRRMDASELISKLEDGFGRSTSLIGLQNLFEELPFELDEDLINEISGIESLSSSKVATIEVAKNDLLNGKNTKQGEKDDKDDSSVASASKVDKKEDPILKEEFRLIVKSALRVIPLYFFVSMAESFDDLVFDLGAKNNRDCQSITGLKARSLKKILEVQSQEKKQAINQGIMRFRGLEKKDHDSFAIAI